MINLINIGTGIGLEAYFNVISVQIMLGYAKYTILEGGRLFYLLLK
jgi:hypothetical protein